MRYILVYQLIRTRLGTEAERNKPGNRLWKNINMEDETKAKKLNRDDPNKSR